MFVRGSYLQKQEEERRVTEGLALDRIWGLLTVVSAGKERSSSPVASSGFCPVFLRYLASDEEDVVVESGL